MALFFIAISNAMASDGKPWHAMASDGKPWHAMAAMACDGWPSQKPRSAPVGGACHIIRIISVKYRCIRIHKSDAKNWNYYGDIQADPRFGYVAKTRDSMPQSGHSKNSGQPKCPHTVFYRFLAHAVACDGTLWLAVACGIIIIYYFCF